MKKYTRWMWSQLMLHACFWRSIFFVTAFPHTHKYLITNISSQLISVESLTVALSTIVINSLYNRYSDWIFRHFKMFCIVECLLYAIILPLVGVGVISPSCYFVTDIVAGAVICRFIHCGANRLRRLVYDREEREQYDNAQPIAAAVASIIGGLLSMLPIPLWMAWCCIAGGVVVDDVFYWMTYNRSVR